MLGFWVGGLKGLKWVRPSARTPLISILHLDTWSTPDRQWMNNNGDELIWLVQTHIQKMSKNDTTLLMGKLALLPALLKPQAALSYLHMLPPGPSHRSAYIMYINCNQRLSAPTGGSVLQEPYRTVTLSWALRGHCDGAGEDCTHTQPCRFLSFPFHRLTPRPRGPGAPGAARRCDELG